MEPMDVSRRGNIFFILPPQQRLVNAVIHGDCNVAINFILGRCHMRKPGIRPAGGYYPTMLSNVKCVDRTYSCRSASATMLDVSRSSVVGNISLAEAFLTGNPRSIHQVLDNDGFAGSQITRIATRLLGCGTS